METTVNKVEIQGFLGRDAEVKTFDSGRTLLSMSLATNESFKNSKGEWVSNTIWHNVTHWVNTKDRAYGFLTKGALVLVRGKLNSRKYTDKTGQDRYVTEVVAHTMEPAKVEVQ